MEKDEEEEDQDEAGRDQSFKNSLLSAAHLKDLEASDVQDAQEGRGLSFALVQGLVHSGQDPAKKAVVHGLRQRLDGKIGLEQTEDGGCDGAPRQHQVFPTVGLPAAWSEPSAPPLCPL